MRTPGFLFFMAAISVLPPVSRAAPPDGAPGRLSHVAGYQAAKPDNPHQPAGAKPAPAVAGNAGNTQSGAASAPLVGAQNKPATKAGQAGPMGSVSQTPCARARPQSSANPAAPGAEPANKRGNQRASSQLAAAQASAGNGAMAALSGAAVYRRSAGPASLGGPASGSDKKSLTLINGGNVNLKRKF